MAKIAFTKLGLTKETAVDTFDWNGQTIEVKVYLPIEEKLVLLSNIINNSIDSNGYYNSARLYINTIIEVVLAYTNITVTEKQRADVFKLYDLLVSSGFSGKVIGEHMNPAEYQQIRTWLSEIVHSIYEYKNSAMGIMEALGQDFGELDLDAENIQKKLADPENMALLRNILTKLG